MSVRQKIKKNRRMNEFVRKYYCQLGKHIVPANKLHSVIPAELAAVPEDWPEGEPRFLGSHAVRGCDHHIFTHDMVKIGMPS